MSYPRDIALTEDEDGEVLAHRADCPYARALSAAGKPVVTMLDCEQSLPPELRRHECLAPSFGRTPS